MRIFGAAFCLLIASGTPAIANDYWLIGHSSTGAYLIDSNRIEESHDGFRQAWVLMVSNPAYRVRAGYAYNLMLISFDCGGKKLSNLNGNRYKQNGEVVSSYSDPYPTYDLIVPDSIGESELKFVCIAENRIGTFVELGDVSTERLVSSFSSGRPPPSLANILSSQFDTAPPDAHPSEVLPRIPARFRGEWNKRLGDCGTDMNDSRLRLSARYVRFYESEGPVLSVTAHGPTEISVQAKQTGEGETWRTRFRFQLSADGQSLTDPGSSTDLVRYRCPLNGH